MTTKRTTTKKTVTTEERMQGLSVRRETTEQEVTVEVLEPAQNSHPELQQLGGQAENGFQNHTMYAPMTSTST